MSDPIAEYRTRVIETADRLACFLRREDGIWIFWPDAFGGGWSAADLRVIADELDRRNAELNEHIKENL